MYDFLIVGAGLFGCVCAQQLTEKGFSCLVIEKNPFIGGTCYTQKMDGIIVHMYGAHIFRTNDEQIWDYVNRFAHFNHFINSPLAFYKGELYNLPFNMNTFHELWGVKTPSEAREKIKNEIVESGVNDLTNLENWAISQVGTTIYQKLIKGYTEKQWGRECSQLPKEIMRRIPIRFIYDNNYYDSEYQGIPIGGYTPLMECMLKRSTVLLSTDYLTNRNRWNHMAKKIIYSGPIDEFYDYCFGSLEYRGLRFEIEKLGIEDYQGNAVVNYTEKEVPFTRIIEHKHFEYGKQANTIISKEYPCKWEKGSYPFYPVNNSINESIFEKYKKISEKETKVYFGGRLGAYQYLDMQDTISMAINFCNSFK
jgi:UDP-galactopyranose mutase